MPGTGSKKYIPRDKTIWEAFYGDGQSGQDLESMGFNVIHEPIDFFSHDEGDVIVSNIPFSKKKDVFTLGTIENATLSRKTTDIGAGAVKRTHAHAIILI